MLLSRTVHSASHQVTLFQSSSGFWAAWWSSQPSAPHWLMFSSRRPSNSCVWLRENCDQSLFEAAEDCGSACYGVYVTPYSYSCSLVLFHIHQMLHSVCTIMWLKGRSGSVRVIVVGDHCVTHWEMPALPMSSTLSRALGWMCWFTQGVHQDGCCRKFHGMSIESCNKCPWKLMAWLLPWFR